MHVLSFLRGLLKFIIVTNSVEQFGTNIKNRRHVHSLILSGADHFQQALF